MNSSFQSRTQNSATKVELFRAAESVVEAAICYQETMGYDPISSDRKATLVQAVFEDPGFTEYLFQDSFYNQV